jgi:hypothetical protein
LLVWAGELIDKIPRFDTIDAKAPHLAPTALGSKAWPRTPMTQLDALGSRLGFLNRAGTKSTVQAEYYYLECKY